MFKPVFDPKDAGRNLTSAPWRESNDVYPEAPDQQLALLEPALRKRRVAR